MPLHEDPPEKGDLQTRLEALSILRASQTETFNSIQADFRAVEQTLLDTKSFLTVERTYRPSTGGKVVLRWGRPAIGAHWGFSVGFAANPGHMVSTRPWSSAFRDVLEMARPFLVDFVEQVIQTFREQGNNLTAQHDAARVDEEE